MNPVSYYESPSLAKSSGEGEDSDEQFLDLNEDPEHKNDDTPSTNDSDNGFTNTLSTNTSHTSEQSPSPPTEHSPVQSPESTNSTNKSPIKSQIENITESHTTEQTPPDIGIGIGVDVSDSGNSTTIGTNNDPLDTAILATRDIGALDGEGARSNDNRADTTTPTPSKKQKKIIDLTDDTKEPPLKRNTSSRFNSVGCLGCSSFFASRLAHESHRLMWKGRGNTSHVIDNIHSTLKHDPRPFPPRTAPFAFVPAAPLGLQLLDSAKVQRRVASAKRPNEAVHKLAGDAKKPKTRATPVTATQVEKAKPIPSIVQERLTLDSLSTNKNFTNTFIQSADTPATPSAKSRYPQTYIPVPPLSSKKVVPLNPEPSMMTLLLHNVKYAVLFDLDNMSKWCTLQESCKDIFIWGFYGATLPGMPIWNNPHINEIAEKQRIWFTACGSGANSADFGLAYHAAQLSMLLPPAVPFIIVSGDRDHFHTMGLLLTSGRRTFKFDKNQGATIDRILIPSEDTKGFYRRQICSPALTNNWPMQNNQLMPQL